MKMKYKKSLGYILGAAALIFCAVVYADSVMQWDLRDYDNNGSISAFTFVSPPQYPDGTTGDSGGIRFGDQTIQRDPATGLPYDPPLPKETRCFATPQELAGVFPGGILDEPYYLSDFGQPCAPILFDKGAPTNIDEFTFGFLFSGAPFLPAIAATKSGVTPLTGDMSADITIDKAGNYNLKFSKLDFAGQFGTSLFILPPTTTAPDVRVVDPGLAFIQDLVPLGGGQFGAAVQWVSEIFEVGAPTNGFIARWRVEGVMTVNDDSPTIFLNCSNPASVPPFGSYTDGGAVCQDVVDGQITASSAPPASFSTIPSDPNIPDVGPAGQSYTVTYSCTDSGGMNTQVVRTINVETDTTPPDVTLLAGPDEPGVRYSPDGTVVDILQGVTYIDAGATCLDNADCDIPLGATGSPSFTFAPSTVDTSVPSTGNEITFTCTDTSGNTTTAKRLVNVIADTLKPEITLGGTPVVTVTVGSDYTVNQPPATCLDTNPIDTNPIDISQNVVVTPSSVDTRYPHTVELTYTCEDSAGNAADPVKQIVDVVQGKAYSIQSMTISDVDNDGLAGCFKFGSLDPATCQLANAFSSDGSVTGLSGGNATIPGSGTDLDDNGNPIGVRFGTFQSTKAISPGFMFTGFPFEPFTFDPPSETAIPPAGVVLVSDTSTSLIIQSFPFGGLYSSSKPNAFFLDPDEGTLSTSITADNNDDDGTTRSFNYLMTWSHFITQAEDPTGQFPTFNAFWRLEGKVTVDSNPITVNNPPIVDQIASSQGIYQSTRIIVTSDGLVTVTPSVIEPDGDKVVYDWRDTESALVPIGGATNETFVFDPSALKPGFYTLRLNVADDNIGGPKSTSAYYVIRVLSTAPILGQEDSDGDGIPDDVEGYGDDDNDGLPNYQDPINGLVDPTRNRIDYATSGDVTSDKGRLLLGDTAFCAFQSSFIVSQSDISKFGGEGCLPVDNGGDRLNDVDGLGHSGGGIFDWTVSGINVGDNVCVILPQKAVLPSMPIYRRYSRLNGWVDFKTSGGDTLASTKSANGVCPENSDDYDDAKGLVAGDDCVRVCVTDGGPNDLDNQRNGSVSDPATAANNGAVPKSDSNGGGCSIVRDPFSVSALRSDLWLFAVFFTLLGLTRRSRRLNRY